MRLMRNANQLMLIIGLTCIALALFLVGYYAVTIPVERSFGERYVESELPLVFPFYAIMSFKPLTIITYLSFAGGVLILEACKDRLRKLETRGAKVLLLILAFASGYEVIWNFFAWFSTWQKTGGAMDLIPNATHEYVVLPANFNFATKVTFLIFSLSLYGAFFLQNLELRFERP